MKRLAQPLALAALAVALTSTSAFAELQSALQAYVVETQADGQETYEPAYSVEPGQVIEYRLQHTNTFDNAIGGVTVVGPVPPEAVFDAGSASSSESAVFEVRADLDPDQPGEEWSQMPAMRVVIRDDGTRVLEEAGPEHFTAVRWRIVPNLESSQVVTNSYRVRVR